VLGDPAEVEFTQLVVKEFGWAPPNPRGRFNILPVLQAHPDQRLEVRYVILLAAVAPAVPATAATAAAAP
jgi:nitric oxide synthase oxygenase domain/subunit